MELKVENFKRRPKPTRHLFKLRGRIKFSIFVAVVLVSCLLICMLINASTNDYVNHSTMCNHSIKGIQTKQDNLSEVSERIRTLAENIRTPPNAEAESLYNTVRVLCWVLTMPENHMTRARHVRATWGRRCNKLIFMSSTTDPTLGNVVNLNVSEGRQHLWEKTQNAFEYVYEHNLDEADWFLKADDDTYIIVENLRHFLRNRPSEDPVYFGYQFDSGGFVSGGAGYVLSRRSVQLLVERGLHSGSCPNVSEAEDVQIHACLKVVGVSVGDSRDSQGRERFFPFIPIEAIFNNVYYEYEVFSGTKDMQCSDTAISFHYVPPQLMYVLEYIIYNLKLNGGAYPEERAIAYQLK